MSSEITRNSLSSIEAIAERPEASDEGTIAARHTTTVRLVPNRKVEGFGFDENRYLGCGFAGASSRWFSTICKLKAELSFLVQADFE